MIPLLSSMVFVFGSNLSGRHGAGAAYEALKRGYPMGLAVGMHRESSCYGLPTKDCSIETLPLWVIALYIEQLKETAARYEKIPFQVTRVGCGLARDHEVNDHTVAPLFINSPANLWFDDAWRLYLPHTYNYWGKFG